MSIREASRIVGINRRTGQEWVSGHGARVRTTKAGRKTVRTAIQPVVGDSREFELHPRAEERNSSRSISVRFLSEEERVLIADLRREGKSIRAIAGELNRSPSTISREICRNGSPDTRPTIRPTAARSSLTDARKHDCHGSSLGRSTVAPSCGPSSRPGWTRNGAPSRSRTSFVGTSQIARRCM
ncbi:helix-turn-helix domain-containing protein [Streptomyces sp. BE147]|uniref:helix-turn-helix domain-containing protein n=1 Tax=Streptomyces sp. BE147 TaxID=3002524 RepID=UPI003FA7EBEE